MQSRNNPISPLFDREPTAPYQIKAKWDYFCFALFFLKAKLCRHPKVLIKARQISLNDIVGFAQGRSVL